MKIVSSDARPRCQDRCQSFELPWPPSLNHYWRSVIVNGKPRVLLGAQGRRYRDNVARALNAQRAQGYGPDARLAIRILARPPDRRKRDLDNLAKGPLDALQAWGMIRDDAQFDSLHIVRLNTAPAELDGLHIDIALLDPPGAAPLQAEWREYCWSCGRGELS